MGENIPIRHHYIPQFILRSFCNETGILNVYNPTTKEISYKKPENVFMVRNLYRDEINNPNNPVKIEKDFAIYESEIALTINKFLTTDIITLTVEEEESLRLFLAIMGFRSGRTGNLFGHNESEEFRDYYGVYQENGDLSDFWKRNLSYLVNCRSILDVIKHESIDEPIKKFMIRDTMGSTCNGMYIMIVERRGKEDFLISDCYPLVIEGHNEDGTIRLELYKVYPISPKRAIMLVANGVEQARLAASGFQKDFFREPKVSRDRKSLTIKVIKLYELDVKRFNQIAFENAAEGIVFQNIDLLEKYK
ncbi:DUF4238 domain-containing protein [Pseudobutyrivibrio xylanivorans]|uniref:DUF4238 domain-containing protein n=1 Tax=Pseudobutyrivibrio xylanivorans TaxID=185007 RepID=A0A1G5S4S9_PSEXY|nr:DUF4238 domain-containing protein [Pseudobutyrivibrio xylanivorans]SCZ81333.1 Protein of unknown function [Pseudobutyrivibrio xylanivorans]